MAQLHLQERTRLVRFLTAQWFLLALAVVLACGIFGSATLAPLLEWSTLRDAIVFGVLYLMAWPLDTASIRRTLIKPWAPLLATAINFGLLPLFAWGVSLGLSPMLAAGLMLAAATPCTLASAAVWTRRAEGNDAAAIMVTMITNLLCFIVTPMWLKWTVGGEAEIPLAAIVSKLGLLVVLPMFLAQITRVYQPLAKWTTANKKRLSTLAQAGLLAMVLLGSIRTGLQIFGDEGAALTLVDAGLMIGAVLVVHLSMLTVGILLSRLFGFARSDQVAVGIAGSQKTLMVGITAGLDLGITIMPLVAYHVCQLLVDTLIADWWRNRNHRIEAAESKAKS